MTCGRSVVASSTNEKYRYDIAEILLKVALNTTTPFSYKRLALSRNYKENMLFTYSGFLQLKQICCYVFSIKETACQNTLKKQIIIMQKSHHYDCLILMGGENSLILVNIYILSALT